MATKPGIILSVAAGIIITSAVALGGWNLSKTASIPETYATKVEVKEVQHDAEKDRDRIREDVQRSLDGMVTEQRSIKEAINDLNRYLREGG
jgi:hypothetical protein